MQMQIRMKSGGFGAKVAGGLMLSIVYSLSWASPAVTLKASPDIESVYAWSKDRCADDFIPNAPARAFRRTDGSIVVIAAHYTNSILEGSSFQLLKPNCAVRSGGGEDSDPSNFNDRFWVQGLMRAPNRRIVALLSHEYQGKRHLKKCAFSSKPGPQCWYSSILLGEADESNFEFSLLPKKRRIVAAPPKPFDPSQPARTGYFTTTNIVRKDAYAYFLAWGELEKFRGNCLFRSSADAPTGPWLGLRDNKFQQQYISPYDVKDNDQRCDAIGAKQLGPLRSVVWLKKHQVFVGVFAIGPGSTRLPGIYYSTSPDLISWSDSALLFGGSPWYGTRACGQFWGYPSLIDHESVTPEFDTADHDLHLYLTRYNWQNCVVGLNQDLVRMNVLVADPDRNHPLKTRN